jgi:hypothetical protein
MKNTYEPPCYSVATSCSFDTFMQFVAERVGIPRSNIYEPRNVCNLHGGAK